MLDNALKYMHDKRVPREVQLDVAALINVVGELTNRLTAVGAGLVVCETILEAAGILTPELMERVRPLVTAKLIPASAPAPAEASAPEETKPE